MTRDAIIPDDPRWKRRASVIDLAQTDVTYRCNLVTLFRRNGTLPIRR